MRLELLFKTHVTRASTEQNSQSYLEKTGGGAFNYWTQFTGPFAGKWINIVTGVDIFWNRLKEIRNTDPFFLKFFVKNSWFARNLEKRGYSLWKRRENYQRREIRIDFGFFVLLQGSKTLKIQFRVYKNSKTRASKFPNTLLVSKVN